MITLAMISLSGTDLYPLIRDFNFSDFKVLKFSFLFEGVKGQRQESPRDRPPLEGLIMQAHRQHRGRLREHAQQPQMSPRRHGDVSHNCNQAWFKLLMDTIYPETSKRNRH
jgi:hypothetical protein